MNINTQITISATDLFDAIEMHVAEFIEDLDYCNSTEVDSAVGNAIQFEVSDIADDIGALETEARGRGSLINENCDRLDVIEETLLDIRAEDADTLRAVAQDVIDGNDFIDEDELSERIDGLLEEDDLAWRVEDIIGDADLMTEDEVRDLIDEKIADNQADDKEMLRRQIDDRMENFDISCHFDLIKEIVDEQVKDLRTELAMAMNEAMIARRSTTTLLERQPRERIRNAYWTVRNFITDLRIRKG